MIVSTTNLLAPIHEVGHVLVATHEGYDSEITGWDTTCSPGSLSQAVAGYWIEVLFFCSAGQFIAAIAKGKWWLAGFFFGHAFMAMFLAWGSYDFNEYIDIFAQQVRLSPDELKKAVQNRWILLCTALMVINAPIVYFRYWRKDYTRA